MWLQYCQAGIKVHTCSSKIMMFSAGFEHLSCSYQQRECLAPWVAARRSRFDWPLRGRFVAVVMLTLMGGHLQACLL